MGNALAADQTPPKIVEAAMGDADHDQKADRLVLTYSEKVKHPLDTDGNYPFNVKDYKVTRVAAASGKSLTLVLKEKPSADASAKPQVKYVRTSADPVKDLAGNQAAGQTYLDTFPLAAVFVSPTGDDANEGTQAAPKLTVPEAITKAGQIGALDVYLAGGTYAGPIHPSGNMTIWGGFTASFARSDALPNKAVLTGGKDVDTGQFGTVFILDFGGTMSLVRLTIEGPDATDPGATSYAIVVRNSVVVIKKSTILAGDGADGADGGNGADATTGIAATLAMDGGDGGSAAEFSASCDNFSHGAAGPAGTNSGAPAGLGTAGGPGGAGGEMDTDCGGLGGTCAIGGNCDATAGDDGIDGAQAAGEFGGHGAGKAANSCLAGTGGDGGPGLVTNGAAGSGASGGFMNASFWAPRNGTDGQLGENGGGGGGGGGSGGCDTGTDSYGAGGGGGGAGGARAESAGGHGNGGGGSFGIFVFSTAQFQASVTVTGTKIVGGTAGDGGTGGAGGEGQAGGLGGDGGLSVGDSAAGGAGGDGGHGGHGGGGGGGAGGYSYLIYMWQSVLTQSNNMFTVGTAGLGGGAGSSPGDGNDGGPGGAGAAGDIGSCSLLLIC